MIALMGGNPSVGIYITYGLMVVLSCMFYDPKLTLRISVVCYVLLLISLFIRSCNIVLTNASQLNWFIGYSLGFTIEFILLTSICISITSSSRNILDKLHNTIELESILSTCENASNELATMVDVLHDDITKTTNSSNTITESSQTTLDDLNKSKTHVINTKESIIKMTTASDTISAKTDELLDIAAQTTNQMDNYTHTINNTVSDMENIKNSTNTTDASIQNLSDGITEIASFANYISELTSQTNLLALNASIEAARADEHGKGFSVVAESVRELAENSKEASDAITSIIDNVTILLEDVKKSNNDNISLVNNGIYKISTIKNDIEEIYNLQSNIKTMTEDIVHYCNSTKKHTKNVETMILEMDEIVTDTMTRATNIVEETTNQISLLSSVENSFINVDNISKKLLNITLK